MENIETVIPYPLTQRRLRRHDGTDFSFHFNVTKRSSET